MQRVLGTGAQEAGSALAGPVGGMIGGKIAQAFSPKQPDAPQPAAPAKPQISLKDFAATVKQKYPVYAKYSDEQLGQKVLEKYPQYKARILPATLPTLMKGTLNVTADGSNMPKQSFLSKFLGGANDLLNKAADNTVEQQKEAGEKMISSVQAGREKLGPASEKADINAEGAAIGETGLGVASGAVQGVFAPITGIIQAISDKASDTDAMQQFAEHGTGPILDLYDSLEKKIGEISQAHPEAAQNIGDAANVLLATLGGETKAGAALDTNMKGTGAAMSKSLRDVTIGPDDGGGGGPPGGAVGAVRDAAAATAENAKTAGKTVADIFGKTKQASAEKIAGAKNSVGTQTGGALKSAYSQIYGLPPGDIDFLLQHPEYATPEALSNASLSNLGSEVETKINEARGNIPSPDDLTEQVRQGLQTKVQALNEHAKQYSTIGSDTRPGQTRRAPNVKVDPNWLHDQLANKSVAGVEIGKDNRISHGDADSRINSADSPEGARRLQDLWDTWGPKFAKGVMSTSDFLRFRQSLASIADYKGGVDTALNKAAHTIRNNANKEFRPQIKGLTELDAEHERMQKDLNDSLTGVGEIDKTSPLPKIKMNEGAAGNILNGTKDTKTDFAKRLEKIAPGIIKKIGENREFNKKWSDLVDMETGKQRRGALLDIKNSLNFGRDANLERLEQLMPGIADRLRLIKASENYHGTLGLKPGKYASGAAVSQILTGNPFVGIAAMAATNPSVGLRILRLLSKTKQP